METEKRPYLPGQRGHGSRAGCSVTEGLDDFCRVAEDQKPDKDKLPEAKERAPPTQSREASPDQARLPEST